MTEIEYLQLYNSLVKEETYHIEFSKSFLDEMIERLKYSSKSGKSSVSYCTQQFKYKRILNVPINRDIFDSVEISSRIGKNCHFVYDKVWDKINLNTIRKFNYYEDISKYFYKKCISFIPLNEIAIPIYKYLLKQYSDYESFRIMEILNEIGNTTTANKYIEPVYRELALFNEDSNNKGIIDVILRLINDEITITDYKTGKPKYYFPYEENEEIIEPTEWDKKDIAYEISEYFDLLNGKVYRFLDKDNYKLFDPPLVNYGRVLYLRDWIRTYNFLEINEEIMDVSKEIERKYINIINSGKFYRRISTNCPVYCKFYPICKTALQWKTKHRFLEPIFKESFKYFAR
ncbi:MAG: hypothetical protein ACFFG0_53430 [Candidatus Thorarchaeota archaeon]